MGKFSNLDRFVPVRQTKLAVYMEGLSKTDRSELEDVMRGTRYSTSVIVAALKADDLSVDAQAVKKVRVALREAAQNV